MIEILETKDYDLIAEMNEQVQSLHHTLYPEIFKPYEKVQVIEFFKKVLSQENVMSFIAVENGGVLGYVLLFINKIEENPFQHERRYVLLDQLLVLESSREKGIGKLLIDKTFSLTRSLNISVIELNHWTLNEAARYFFNNNGFKLFNEKMSINI